MTLPVIMTSEGPQARTPAQLRALLIQIVAAQVPGYTADLPGSLIEDIASTDTAAIAMMESAMVETVNSLSPLGANEFLLKQLGQIYGVEPGAATNTSVYVVFTGDPGFVIAQGFTVSDGTYQYTVRDGGIIGSSGVTNPLYCVATQSGSWAIPPGTVTELITSVPNTVTLSCNNPTEGTPGGDAESAESYRAAVLQAGLANAQGTIPYLKTLLGNIEGVQRRLISVRQSTDGWMIIVGGGDPYQVGYAIYWALFDMFSLVGSTLNVTGITKANPGVVTTDLNHGFETGQVIQINGATGMTQINAVNLTITVLSEKTFSVGVNTSSYGVYTGNGVVTPNLRNITVDISDFPDIYDIPFVNPPQQTVEMSLVWNTTSVNFVSPSAIAQLGSPALVDYINSIPVGAPINVFEMQTVFQEAVSSVLSPSLLTRMVFTVSINGVSTPPDVGTGIIEGDPESFFFTDSTKIDITQG